MRLPIILLAMLMLATGCETSRPAATIEAPALGLPILLSPEGWAALDAADPAGARAVDETNARYLCGYAPEGLTPDDFQIICGGR